MGSWASVTFACPFTGLSCFSALCLGPWFSPHIMELVITTNGGSSSQTAERDMTPMS